MLFRPATILLRLHELGEEQFGHVLGAGRTDLTKLFRVGWETLLRDERFGVAQLE